MLRAKRSLLTAALATALLGATAVSGQPFGPPGPVPFAALDGDGDGYVTAEEFAQHRNARMAARAAQGRLMRNAGQAPVLTDWDKDGDGRLSQEELTSGQTARYQSRWAQMPGPYGMGRRPCWMSQ